MDEIAVRVEAEINPTEDRAKVEKSVTNIFDNISVEIKQSYKGSVIYAQAEGRAALAKFRSLLSLDRIRAAARKVLLGGLAGNIIRFYLNKQVAHAGHVTFSEEKGESPLGPIKVTIECEKPQQLINWLAPRTD
ncbi:hypothetical protein E2P61_07065 [Candidatus Bathyarchaeota archaeon]|jgi:predicted RNA binding protein with dsRBD fold (UPF0201 family)|nr:hypothetical protein E2P61_07065 [Candidatus Bathyarchaeota archaeon]